MGKYLVGDVVVVRFPFSDLSGQKLRPALVLANVEFGNVILCQITSKPYSSKIAIQIEESDFSTGKLPIKSYVRPDKLFTAEVSIIEKNVGCLMPDCNRHIRSSVQKIFK